MKPKVSETIKEKYREFLQEKIKKNNNK